MTVWIRPKQLIHIQDIIRKSNSSVAVRNDPDGGIVITNTRSKTFIIVDYNGKIKS